MKGDPCAGRWRIARTVAPTLDAVDALCRSVRERLKDRASGADWFGVELLLREALTNAVLHAGSDDAGRRVRCEVSVGARRARLVVEDGGPGFDWRAALARTPTDAAASGRGLKIYEMYADRVSFNRAGNRVVLERRLSADERDAPGGGKAGRAAEPRRRRAHG